MTLSIDTRGRNLSRGELGGGLTTLPHNQRTNLVSYRTILGGIYIEFKKSGWVMRDGEGKIGRCDPVTSHTREGRVSRQNGDVDTWGRCVTESGKREGRYGRCVEN